LVEREKRLISCADVELKRTDEAEGMEIVLNI
jgi:hypothetical protein